MQNSINNKNIFMSLKTVSENFSDIRVDVQGKTYNCHKIILSSVSEFFDRLLNTECKETSSGVIKLEDVQSSAFDIIYEFIYSAGDAAVLNKTSSLLLLELLECGDKWFMPFLTESCINVLTSRCHSLNLNELIKVYEKVFLLKETQRNSLLNMIEHRLSNLGNQLNCKEAHGMNSISFKGYVKFCASKLSQVERFKMVEKWIITQKLNKVGVNDRDPEDVAELLSMINYDRMTYNDFQSGPGNSALLSLQSKYDLLCKIKSASQCRYCGRQNQYNY